ncbi:hypothetical protein SDC9_129354 [bioreactor metagenome]|uniref:Uncharacterized protein n=1 Tax=bioreactor metagenome TaxID=1076179 RepID=A0A645CZK2_9ZZZZ
MAVPSTVPAELGVYKVTVVPFASTEDPPTEKGAVTQAVDKITGLYAVLVTVTPGDAADSQLPFPGLPAKSVDTFD